MAVDLIILWIASRAVASQARRRWLYAAWMVGALARRSRPEATARMESRGFDPTPSLALVALRLGVLVSALEAYFLSTLLWMPKLFDRLEKVAAELTIAVRQLRARKSGFLTVISFLAFLGVGLGSFALCMTISIMGGFGNDLKHKILGNNAHVVVDRERGGFTDWRPCCAHPGAARGDRRDAAGAGRGDDHLADQPVRGDPPGHRPGAGRGGQPPARAHPRPHRVPGRPLEARSPEPERPSPGGGARRARDSPRRASTASRASATRAPSGRRLRARPTDPLPGIVVGRELATNLHLAVGDEVRVVSPFGSIGPLGPMPKTKLFRVAGIFYSGMYEYDTKYAYVLIPVAQRFFNYRDDAITAIEVRLRDVDLSDQVVAAVEGPARARSLRVRDWKQLNQNLFRALKLEKLLIWLLLTVAIIVASFSIVATLLLLVTEKGREIAVLKAMGASDGFITRVFLSVGGLIGVVGALLGTTAPPCSPRW
jgi:lipoprotein-releasing system permease protein